MEVHNEMKTRVSTGRGRFPDDWFGPHINKNVVN
jgi:hypothetical protein